MHEDGDGASEGSACHPEPESEPGPSRIVPDSCIRASFLNGSFSPTLKLCSLTPQKRLNHYKATVSLRAPKASSCSHHATARPPHHANIGTPDAHQKDPFHHRLKKTAGFFEIKGPHHPVKRFRSQQVALRPHNTAFCHRFARVLQ